MAMHPDYVWEKNKQALKLLDMFVGDDPVALSGRNSGIIRVLKGCIVKPLTLAFTLLILIIMAYYRTPYVGMTPKKNGGHIKSAQMTRSKFVR